MAVAVDGGCWYKATVSCIGDGDVPSHGHRAAARLACSSCFRCAAACPDECAASTCQGAERGKGAAGIIHLRGVLS